MVGGGNKRDDGISSTNIFAALDSRRRKSSKKDKKDSISKPPPQKAAQFWAPTPVLGKSWADVDDDDDYFATSVPPPSTEEFDQAADTVTQGDNETLSQSECAMERYYEFLSRFSGNSCCNPVVEESLAYNLIFRERDWLDG